MHSLTIIAVFSVSRAKSTTQKLQGIFSLKGKTVEIEMKGRVLITQQLQGHQGRPAQFHLQCLDEEDKENICA